MQVAAGDQAHVLALDQRAVGGQAVVGLGQVKHGGQDFLAVDLGFFHPHDVVGQCRDLFGGEGHAQLQVERVLVRDGVVHQVAEQCVVAGEAVDVALAGRSENWIIFETYCRDHELRTFPTTSRG